MKLLLEDLEGFITFLKDKGVQGLFYSVKLEASDLTETPEGVGRIHRAIIGLQAIDKQRLVLHFEIVEQLVSDEKQAKKFAKAVDEKLQTTLDTIKQKIPEMLIYKGVVEL